MKYRMSFGRTGRSRRFIVSLIPGFLINPNESPRQNASIMRPKCDQKRECEFSTPVTSATCDFRPQKWSHFSETDVLPPTSVRCPSAQHHSWNSCLFLRLNRQSPIRNRKANWVRGPYYFSKLNKTEWKCRGVSHFNHLFFDNLTSTNTNRSNRCLGLSFDKAESLLLRHFKLAQLRRIATGVFTSRRRGRIMELHRAVRN